VLILVLAGNFVYWAINSVVNQGMSIAPVIKLFFYAAPGFRGAGHSGGRDFWACACPAIARCATTKFWRCASAARRCLALWLRFWSWRGREHHQLGHRRKSRAQNHALAEKSLARLIGQSAAPFHDPTVYFHAGPYYFYVGPSTRACCAT
jgi:hypothetical protein